jgi:hypothetical protein
MKQTPADQAVRAARHGLAHLIVEFGYRKA